MRGFGIRSQVQPLSLSLPFLSVSMMRVVSAFQPSAAIEVAVVLHGLGPVVHQVLVDIIRVDERLAGVVNEQVLRELGDDVLRMAAGLQGLER